jgi:hypothetical protein
MLINHGGRNIHHDGRNIYLSSRRPVAVESHKFKQDSLSLCERRYQKPSKVLGFQVSGNPETSGNPEYNFHFADVTSLNLHPEHVFVSISIVSYSKVRLMCSRFRTLSPSHAPPGNLMLSNPILINPAAHVPVQASQLPLGSVESSRVRMEQDVYKMTTLAPM